MKKLIALLLSLITILAIAPSCSINDTEVSVIWLNYSAERALNGECDQFQATIADAFDRGAYIEKIDHVDYDAENDPTKQLTLAEGALERGCSALVVYATELTPSVAIVKAAEAKDVSVTFICESSLVALAIKTSLALPVVGSSYEKVAIVAVDTASLATVLGSKIADDLIANYDKFDRNKDGKISYISFSGASLLVPEINAKLVKAEKPEIEMVSFGAISEGWTEAGEPPYELILTGNNDLVVELLLALREKEFNYKKLVTNFIPFYTVGIEANARDLLIDERLGDKIKEENLNAERIQEEIKKIKNFDKELAAYSVMNAIDSGYISAAGLVNDDEVALSTAAIVRNFIKGNEIMKGVEESYISTEINGVVFVPYTVYPNA